MKLKIKKLHEDAILPTYAHDNDAGMDICSLEKHLINPGETILVKTGISIELPNGYEAQVRPRSGLALKSGITVLNSPGTIDAGYRGEIGVIIINHGKSTFEITSGMRVAQIVICPVIHADIEEVIELTSTDRAAGGFGSTGLK